MRGPYRLWWYFWGQLQKKSEELEKEVNGLAREHQYYTIQKQLLDNIFMADSYLAMIEEKEIPMRRTQSRKTTFYGEGRLKSAVKTRNNSQCEDRVVVLQEQQIRCSNKLQQIIKQQKQLKKQRLILIDRIGQLKIERDRLAGQVYGVDINLRQAQAVQVNKLKIYNKKQQQLQQEINKQDALLQQQYKINQEYKQKIMDRNQQEIKEIKVLQEEIKKCGEQVKEIKLKCDNLEISKIKKTPKNK